MNNFQESSRSARVIQLPARAKLGLGSATLVSSRAVRVAQHGVSLIVEKNIRHAQPCSVELDVFVQGEPRRLSATGKVVSCSCAGMDGFRVSMRFTDLDADSAQTLGQLLQIA